MRKGSKLNMTRMCGIRADMTIKRLKCSEGARSSKALGNRLKFGLYHLKVESHGGFENLVEEF